MNFIINIIIITIQIKQSQQQIQWEVKNAYYNETQAPNSNEEAYALELQSRVNLALSNSQFDGYCNTINPDFPLNSYELCNNFRKRDIAWEFTFKFKEIKNCNYKMEFGGDFGRGMAVFADGQVISTIQKDVWWGKNWNSEAVLRMNFNFSPGMHTISFYGGENCCDGKMDIRMDRDNQGWKQFTKDSLLNFMPFDCQYPCVKCNIDETECYECVISAPQRIVLEQCRCPDSYYQDQINSTCQKCSQQCLTCLDNPDNCQTCQPGRLQSNECQCGQQYYEDSNNLCQRCNSQCNECISEFQCKQCASSNRQLQADLTCKCIQNLGFYENGEPDCGMCNLILCETCLNYPNNCITCSHETRDRFQGSNCPCIKGTIDIGLKECQTCYFKCKECKGNISTCTECIHTTRDLSQNCSCKKGYYESNTNISVKECNKCSIKCQECSDSQSNCQFCSHITRNNAPSCDCIQGYYDTGIEECQKCHYKCTSCEINSTNCILCSDTNRESIGGDKCICKQGYYEAGIAQCGQCNYPCQSCEGSPSNCSQCSGNRQIKPLCNCSSGYYDQENQNPICLQCDSTCKECKSQNNQCTQCKSDQNRNLTGSQCNCQPGYYEVSGQDVCEPCFETCLTCNNSINIDQCTSCQFGGTLQKKDGFITGTCPCQQGKYLDKVSQSCKDCHYSCLQCDQPGVTQCTLCDTVTRYYDNLTNKCECQAGYIEKYTQKCEKCHFKCFSCKDQYDYCLSCNQPTINFRDNNNQCLCLPGYYQQDQLEQCQKCDPTCQTCEQNIISGKQVCLTCKDNMQYINQSECQCQNKLYFDNITEKCEKCYDQDYCLQCFGPYSNECFQCSDGSFIKEGTCVQMIPLFFVQINSTHLSSCQSLGKIYNQNVQNCVEYCPDYTFVGLNQLHQMQECQDCHSSCIACSGPLINECDVCVDGTELCQGKCVYECDDENDPDQDKAQSGQQIVDRFQLSQDVECISRRELEICQGLKQPDCENGFYKDQQDQKCKPCYYSCRKCIGPKYDDCILCQEPFRQITIVNKEKQKGFCDCINSQDEDFDGFCVESQNNMQGQILFTIIFSFQIGIGLIVAIFNGKFFIFEKFIDMAQQIQLIYYTNINFANNYDKTIQQLNLFNPHRLLPQPFNSINSMNSLQQNTFEKNLNSTLIYDFTKFQKNGILQPEFLSNSAILLLTLIIIVILQILFQKITCKKEKYQKYSKIFCNNNILMKVLYLVCSECIIFLALQFKGSDLSDTFKIISFGFALLYIMWFLYFVMQLTVFIKINDISQIQKKQFSSQLYLNPKNQISKYYYIIQLFKKCGITIFTFLFYNSPYIQCSILIFIQLIFTSLQIKSNPYTRRYLRLQSQGNEFLQLVLYLSLFFVILETDQENLPNITSTTILISIMSIQLLFNLLFMVGNFILEFALLKINFSKIFNKKYSYQMQECGNKNSLIEGNKIKIKKIINKSEEIDYNQENSEEDSDVEKKKKNSMGSPSDTNNNLQIKNDVSVNSFNNIPDINNSPLKKKKIGAQKRRQKSKNPYKIEEQFNISVTNSMFSSDDQSCNQLNNDSVEL